MRTYILVTLFGLAVITFHNLYINRLADYFELTFFIKCGMALLAIAVFHLFGRWRLRHAVAVLGEALSPEIAPEHRRHAAWSELMRYPGDIFKAMLLCGALYSPPYHLLTLWLGGITNDELQTTVGLFLLENLLFDQSLSLMLAVLFYVVLRRIVRPFLEQLKVYQLQELKTATIAVPLMAAFVSLFLISMFAVLWYVMNAAAADSRLHLPGLFLTAGATFAIGVGLFAIEVFSLQRNVRDLIGIIRTLLAQKREQLHGQIPIAANDELGLLADSFNRLQERTAREYLEVEHELKLAYNVQQQLLPNSNLTFGPLRVAGVCRPTKDVGGDWFDVQPLPNGSLAVAIGDVTGKGVQAALIMSAAVVLLRTELRRGGAPEDIVRRLNRQLLATMQQATYVTLGLALFHPAEGRLEYVSAGHVAPYRIRAGEITPLDASSLPLGIDADADYRTLRFEIRSGDRYVFYTDGVVESRTESREMLSFTGFEHKLPALLQGGSPETQVRALLDSLPQDADAPYADDQTLVLVSVDDGFVREM
jgi:serine phosphatase RsbU (regulator of sigma subunit)